MLNRPRTRDSRWTILELIRWTSAYFKSHRVENPRASAEVLLAHTLRSDRLNLYLNYDQPLDRSELDRFKRLIKRRARGEPVAYIVGQKEFWSLDLKVDQKVLIPRPETECLVEAVCRYLSGIPPAPQQRILELGTGSGAVVLALAAQHPAHRYLATDRYFSILELALGNVRRHQQQNRIQLLAGDWFLPFRKAGRPFDLIVSNPPYVKSGVIEHLQPEISTFEPRLALDGGRDGLASVRHIIERAPDYLKISGRLFLEIGHDQKEAVQKIIAGRGCYKNTVFTTDYGGSDRVVMTERVS